MNVTIDPGPGRRSRIRHDVTGIAVRQIEGKEVGLLLDATDDNRRLAEVGLRMARRMGQRGVVARIGCQVLTQALSVTRDMSGLCTR